MENKHPFVGIAGNIGVGKTTFTKIVAEKMDWAPFYESVANNPYLKNFYEDMQRWSFNLQIYFLHHRFRVHQEMTTSPNGVIQDRTIYEDVEIFARNLYKMGYMDKRDWKNYSDLFSVMTSFLRKPDLVVYLKASVPTLVKRIQKRGRQYEKDIDIAYLESLNESYEKWINSLSGIPVLTVETDGFNIHKDKHSLDSIINDMLTAFKKPIGQ